MQACAAADECTALLALMACADGRASALGKYLLGGSLLCIHASLVLSVTARHELSDAWTCMLVYAAASVHCFSGSDFVSKVLHLFFCAGF